MKSPASDSQRPDRTAGAAGLLEAPVNYLGPMDERPKFHAQDHRRDNLRYDPHVVRIEDARRFAVPASLEREGLTLVRAATRVADFRDPEQVRQVYLPEVRRLVAEATGASRVEVLGAGGLVRYAERSPYFGTGMNTQPARFPHLDFTSSTAPGLVENVFGAERVPLKRGQRLVGYNIWRALSPAPQDVPLAVCDARTVSRTDLVPADGVYDEGDPSTWWELEAYLLRYNPQHRWLYFRDMQPDEVLVFRAYDNAPSWRAAVPHTAFDDPSCPPDAVPRMSVEARAFAVFD
jgi:hypothetical protein